MTIHARIRYIRKELLRLTQEEFSHHLRMTRANVASIEKERISVTDRVISDICTAFHINEAWLRTGEGDMMAASADNIFDEFAQHYALTSEEKATARFLLRLSKDERAAILHYLKTWAAEITAAEKDTKNTIERNPTR